jgi:hypothetical protein
MHIVQDDAKHDRTNQTKRDEIRGRCKLRRLRYYVQHLQKADCVYDKYIRLPTSPVQPVAAGVDLPESVVPFLPALEFAT